jgi:hypothetical protein
MLDMKGSIIAEVLDFWILVKIKSRRVMDAMYSRWQELQ